MPTLLNSYWNTQIPTTWVRQITGLASAQDISKVNVIVDTLGNIYLIQRFAAVAPNDTSHGWFTVTKFSPSGQILWSKDLNKNVGLGNETIMRNEIPVCCCNLTSFIIVSNFENSTSPPSSRYTKVICLDANTGALSWARGVYAQPFNASFDVFFYQGVFMNANSGNIYVTYQRYGFGGRTMAVITLDSSGIITGARDMGMLGSPSFGCQANGAITRSDGSVLFYGFVQPSSPQQGFTFILNSNGTSVVQGSTLYGDGTAPARFRCGTQLSNGNFVFATDSDLHLLNSVATSYIDCRTTGVTYFLPLNLRERTDGSIALLGWTNTSSSTAINNQWGVASPQYPRTMVSAYSSNLSQIVEYRESNVATASGTPDFTRTVIGCDPANDRYIGAPGFYAISSMDLKRVYAQYATLPNYPATSNQNTFAKFGSATASLPVSTSAATIRTISTPSWTPSAVTTTSYDYAPSLSVTDNTTQQWSYFFSQ